MTQRPGLRTAALATTALVAFAANSVLARLALGAGAIDPASYSTIRLASGALMLLALAGGQIGGSWPSAALLFLYAAPFSFAYVRLTTGTGALILFGAVQVTMIAAGLGAGERPHARDWTGLAVALAGLVWVVFPGLGAPPFVAAALMALAGIAWGVYSIRGRSGGTPLLATAGNFLRATPLALALSAVSRPTTHLTTHGALLAVASGAVASGLGYAVWYTALPRLTATRAATIQLAVPVLAAFAGVALLGEPVSARLVTSAIAILGGVAVAVRR